MAFTANFEVTESSRVSSGVIAVSAISLAVVLIATIIVILLVYW